MGECVARELPAISLKFLDLIKVLLSMFWGKMPFNEEHRDYLLRLSCLEALLLPLPKQRQHFLEEFEKLPGRSSVKM